MRTAIVTRDIVILGINAVAVTTQQMQQPDVLNKRNIVKIMLA